MTNKVTLPINIKKSDIEDARKTWSKVAKKHNWFKSPIYVQVWVNKDGTVDDSVSTTALDKDYICAEHNGKLLKEGKDYVIV